MAKKFKHIDFVLTSRNLQELEETKKVVENFIDHACRVTTFQLDLSDLSNLEINLQELFSQVIFTFNL